MVIAEREIHRIAVIDDNPDDADMMGEIIRDAGFEPIALGPPFHDIGSLLANVDTVAEAAICDHRLRGRANFSGAEAVAGLVKRGIPALLVTQYIDVDADVSIRQWREYIPVLLGRDEADPDNVKRGIADCGREIQGDYLPGRRPWRSLIRIDERSEEAGDTVVDVRVLSWNPYKAVRFPLSLVPKELRGNVVPGAYLFAMVNIGAERSEDLYFRDFEPAPGAESGDDLG